MGRTNCPACGASVDVVKDLSTGEMVALDPNTTDDTTVERYVYTAREPQVMPVAQNAAGFYTPKHDCHHGRV
jgi:hypothetical protein